MNVPIATLVNAVPPPDGAGWIKTATVPTSMWSAPWTKGTTQAVGKTISFSYRTVSNGSNGSNGSDGTTYLQVYSEQGIRSFVARKFTVTVGGVGATDPLGTESDVQSAASALLAYIAANGCPTSSNATVQVFQTAYNANLPMQDAGALALDGLYGADTQAALQATLNAGETQPPPTAPPACVTSNGTTTLPTQIITGSPQTGTPVATVAILGVTAILGVSLVGYAVYRNHKRKASS